MAELGIRCPACGGETEVKRTTQRPGFVLRRRECVSCEHRETTCERIVGDSSPAPAISAGLAAVDSGQLRETAALMPKLAGLMAKSADNPGNGEQI